MAKKSLFEKAEKMTTEMTFEIPLIGDDSKGRILVKPIHQTPTAYSADATTYLHLSQEGACGCIYLNQAQGAKLAEELSRLFLKD